MQRSLTLSVNEFDSELPPLGSTRCYWVLLDRSFNFVYLDPVLSSHMKSEAQKLVGTSFYDYLHPAESEEAKQDIQSIVDSENIHGSIIRVRFVRLPYIRVQLGSTSPVPSHVSQMCADKHDSTYLPLDLVISSIHDGLYLCFFHAVLDKNPQFNNDAESIWTNWCHTPTFTDKHARVLKQSLLNWSRYQPPAPQKFTIPTRIFQLLRQTSTENMKLGLSQIIYSWPPHDGSTGEGSYQPSSFATLMSEISLNPNTAGQLTGAGTSCTRRFKARHQAKCNDNYYSVQSMFVPYGAIIFACFKIEYEYPMTAAAQPSKRAVIPPSSNSNETTTLFDSTAYDPSLYFNSQPYYQQPAVPAPQLSLLNEWTGYSAPAQASNPPIKDDMTQHLPPPPMASVKDEFSQPSHSPQPPHPQNSSHPHQPSLQPQPAQSSQFPMPSVPPLAKPIPTKGPQASTSASASKVNTKANSDKMACTSCGIEKSPEWRRGPSGKKELCNACGLRYARLVSKSDINGATLSGRRRKSQTKNSTKKNKKVSLSPNPTNSNLTVNAPLNMDPPPNLNVDVNASTLDPLLVPPKGNDIPYDLNGFLSRSPELKQSSGYNAYDNEPSYQKFYNQQMDGAQYHMSTQLPLQLPPQQRNLAFVNQPLYSNDNSSNANQFQFTNPPTNVNPPSSFLP
ncbi:hypothetical protein E3P99_03925 [Wallemia hederae]|uniref:GATA-type domain-containing protein n=1 Tax=Wallemia hederae TaxID=1540922 RepID=A0A4T0FCI5_9BASI|nr:hypothetical protein E3P99_03925 [Wallemia hederae]